MASEDNEDDGTGGLDELPPGFVEVAEAVGVDPRLLALFILNAVSEHAAQMGARMIELVRWELATGADRYPRDVAEVSCGVEEE